MRLTLAFLPLVLASTMAAQDSGHYENKHCGFGFTVPAGWKVVAPTWEVPDPCTITVIPSGAALTPTVADEQAITLQFFEGEPSSRPRPDTPGARTGKTWIGTFGPRVSCVRNDAAHESSCYSGLQGFIYGPSYAADVTVGFKSKVVFDELLVTFEFSRPTAADRWLPDDLQEYRNLRCGISFNYPVGWEVSEAGCEITVTPKNFQELVSIIDGVDVYSIEMTAHRNMTGRPEFLDGVDEENGQWFMVGRAGARSPAKAYKRDSIHGFEGEVGIGCYGPQGYAGLCEASSAYLTDDHIAVSILGLPQSTEAFELVKQTLTFH